MKKILFAILLWMPVTMHSAFAADSENQQQNKTETCAKEADGKSTEERYEYMRTCVQRKAIEQTPSGTQEAVQAKAKACKAEAKGKDEAEQKAFLRQCLKKK